MHFERRAAMDAEGSRSGSPASQPVDFVTLGMFIIGESVVVR